MVQARLSETSLTPQNYVSQIISGFHHTVLKIQNGDMDTYSIELFSYRSKISISFSISRSMVSTLSFILRDTSLRKQFNSTNK